MTVNHNILQCRNGEEGYQVLNRILKAMSSARSFFNTLCAKKLLQAYVQPTLVGTTKWERYILFYDKQGRQCENGTAHNSSGDQNSNNRSTLNRIAARRPLYPIADIPKFGQFRSLNGTSVHQDEECHSTDQKA